MFVFRHLLDDEVRQLQSLQTQTPELSAATDDALQDRGGDDGTGQVQLSHLKRPATPGNKQTNKQPSGSPESRRHDRFNTSELNRRTHSVPASRSSSTYDRGQRSRVTLVFRTCLRAASAWVIPSRSTLCHRDSSNLGPIQQPG